MSDLVVEVPPESRLDSRAGAIADSKQFRDFAHRGGQHPPAELAPVVEKLAINLAEPTLDDPTAERFRDDFVDFHRGYDTGVGILVPRPYVITVGRRRS